MEAASSCKLLTFGGEGVGISIPRQPGFLERGANGGGQNRQVGHISGAQLHAPYTSGRSLENVVLRAEKCYPKKKVIQQLRDITNQHSNMEIRL